jgi:hypothetical protein
MTIESDFRLAIFDCETPRTGVDAIKRTGRKTAISIFEFFCGHRSDLPSGFARFANGGQVPDNVAFCRLLSPIWRKNFWQSASASPKRTDWFQITIPAGLHSRIEANCLGLIWFHR